MAQHTCRGQGSGTHDIPSTTSDKNIYLRTHTYTHTHTHTQTTVSQLHECKCVYEHIQTRYVSIYTHTHMYVRTSRSHHCTHVQPHLAFSTYVRIYHTDAHIRIHTLVLVHNTHRYVHTHIHMYTCTRTQTHVHRHIYTDTYTQTRVHRHIHTYTDTYVRTLSDCCWYTQPPGCTRNQFWKLLLPMHLWEHQRRKQSVSVARWEAKWLKSHINLSTSYQELLLKFPRIPSVLSLTYKPHTFV